MPGIIWYIIGRIVSPFSIVYDRNPITLQKLPIFQLIKIGSQNPLY